MPHIISRLDNASKAERDAFRAADKSLRQQTAAWRDYAQQVCEGGGTIARQKHEARGKLFVRDRINLLIDAGSPFLEIGMPAARDIYDSPLPAAAIVCGVAWIQSRPCMIVANDATTKGGAYYPLTVKKHLRAQEIAAQCQLPCIYLVDSGGAFLRGQDEVFADRDHFGRIFYNQSRMSAAGIPQIAAVMGSCTAGGAYIPAMADETIIVKNYGAIYLAGPPLLKAATGEITDSQTLGGAKMHGQRSGLADYVAEDDVHAIRLLRDIVNNFPRPCSDVAMVNTQESVQKILPPRYAVDELYGIAGGDVRRPFEMREVIARLVDDSDFDEFKPQYGETLVTGFARIGGMHVGILANNGALFSQSAQKGAHFIQLAESPKCRINFPTQHIGFYGWRIARSRRHRQIWCIDGWCSIACTSAKNIVNHWRQLWCGKLCNVWACVFSRFYFFVAQCTHCCDGRRASSDGDG